MKTFFFVVNSTTWGAVGKSQYFAGSTSKIPNFLILNHDNTKLEDIEPDSATVYYWLKLTMAVMTATRIPTCFYICLPII